MTIATAIVAVALFAAALRRSRLVHVCGQPVDLARQAILVMRDRTIDDLHKERMIQRFALRLFGVLGSILLRGAAVAAVSFLPILVSDLAGLTQAGEVIAWMSRPDVIAVTTIVLIAGYAGARRT